MKPVRPATVFSLVFVSFLALWVPACSDWPPGEHSDDADNGGSNGGNSTDGTCSGTPISCSALDAAGCAASPGCVDNGGCIGSGFTCDTARSAALCAEQTDCAWSAACSGTPIANCRGVTKGTCQQNPGCTWTPKSSSGSTGGSGSGQVCASYNGPCTSTANCDCGFSCLKLCTACAQLCGQQCSSDAQCKGTNGNGIATPFCARLSPNDTYGACAASK